jgi:hypothetical protein
MAIDRAFSRSGRFNVRVAMPSSTVSIRSGTVSSGRVVPVTLAVRGCACNIGATLNRGEQ